MASPLPLPVLLIDDDEDDYVIVRDLLAELDDTIIRLDWVSTAAAGLTTIAERRHVLYLLDYRLGEFNGLTVLENALAAGCEAPIILLTGKGDRDIERQALNRGAADYLVKDQISAFSLERAIRHALDRKHALDNLRDRERQFRRFFEEDLTGDYIANPDGIITACNPAFARIFGYGSVQAAIGQNLNQVYPLDAPFPHRMQQLKQAGQLTYHEWEGHRVTGESLFLIENMLATYNANGEITEVRGYIFDNTERKQLERQVLTLQKMEAVGRLAGGIAHDFNNLLTVISTYCSLITMHFGEQDERLNYYVEQIQRAGNRAASLTRQLMAFSRRQVLTPVTLNLNTVITDMTDMMHRLLGEDIQLNLNLFKDLPNIRADHAQMEQVVMNLIINARDAMPNGGQLTITTNIDSLSFANMSTGLLPGLYVKLSVSDTGSGISPENHERIFEPFFTTKGPELGTGLGLSIVFGIVRQSHGQITFDTKLNEGTTFIIHFPTFDSEPNAINEAPRNVTQSSLALNGHELIAVVEDDDQIRALLVETLRGFGYEVLPAREGKDLLAMLDLLDEPIELLITDVVMPNMYGTELLSQLRQNQPNLRALFISGYTGDATHDGQLPGLDKPHTGFLQKPFTAEAIAHKIRNLLDG